MKITGSYTLGTIGRYLLVHAYTVTVKNTKTDLQQQNGNQAYQQNYGNFAIIITVYMRRYHFYLGTELLGTCILRLLYGTYLPNDQFA